MATNNLTEGNPGAGGSDANQTPSTPQGQPLQVDLASTVQQLAKDLKDAKGEISALKSGKDKAVDRAEKTMQATIEQLAGYLNVDPEQVRKAQRAQVLDALVEERMTGNPTPAPAGPAAGQGVQAETFNASKAISMVEGYNLAASDPEFITLLRGNPDEAKVKDYVLQKLAPPKQPDPGNVVQSPVLNHAQGSLSAQDKETKYINDMRAARGDRNKLASIKEKARKDGVDIFNIEFS